MDYEGGGLREFISAELAKKGKVPFSVFMEWCLYHPTLGYYTSPGTRAGGEGDYYTSPCVHPVFGHMIARQLLQMSEIVGGEHFDVIEMGAGRGFLCSDLLQWIESNSPLLFERIRYYLLDLSHSSVEEQRQRLAGYSQKNKVFWLDPAAFEESRIRIKGCFLSNELVDSFPVHRVTMDKGKLRELYVTEREGRFVEQAGELSDPRLDSYFEWTGIHLVEGQVGEVNLKALDWIDKVARCLETGFVITIDYGHLADELYSPSRFSGTLRCYHRHQYSADPYVRVGQQDITSSVNFSALIKKGKEVGLEFTGLVPQYRFLIALGILQHIEEMDKTLASLDGLRLRLSLKHLIEPEAGMGEVFKVLIQHKGVGDFQLDGLRDFDSIPWPPF